MKSPRPPRDSPSTPSKSSSILLPARHTRSASSLPSSSPRRPNPPSSQTSPPRVKSLLKNERCLELRETLFEKPDFTSVSDADLKLLIGHLREYAQQCASQEFYAHALRSQQLLDSARAVLTTRVTENRPSEAEIAAQAEIRAQLEQQWVTARQEYEEETEVKRQKLKEKHEHEFRLFEKRWKTKMPQKYRKPSHRVLELRQQEKTLVVSMEIVRALDVHQQIQAKVNVEAEAAQRNLIRDYNLAREKHFEKQRLEMERFEKTRKAGLEVIEADFEMRKDVQSHHENAARLRLSHALNKPRPPNERPVTSQGIPKNRDLEIDNLLPELLAPNAEFVIQCEIEKMIRTRERNAELQKRLKEKDRVLYGALD
jgi:hypothetical protein